MVDYKRVIDSFKILRWYISVFFGVLVLCFTIFTFLKELDVRREKKQLVDQMTFQKTFRLTGLGVQERYNVYLDFCIRIWNVHGKTYHSPSKKFPVPKSMTPTKRSQIWRLNFELAEMMGFAENGRGYYDVFIKGILESSLNSNLSFFFHLAGIDV